MWAIREKKAWADVQKLLFLRPHSISPVRMPHTPLSVRFPAPTHAQPLGWTALGVMLMMILPMDGFGGPNAGSSVTSLAEQEVQRRVAAVEKAVEQLKEADDLFKQGKTAPALILYEKTFTELPDLPLSKEVREIARRKYADAGAARAKELMDEGRYPEATRILDTITSASVLPEHRYALKLKAHLADPDRYPPALTHTHIEKVDEVTKLLTLANSQYEIGDYDKARATFQDVVRLDPYNTAARRGMERAEAERAQYFKAARDHHRAGMLNGVNGQWDEPLPARVDVSSLFGGIGAIGTKGGREALVAKLRDTRVPNVDFQGVTLNEVIEYLRVRVKDLDPSGKGIDFVVNLPDADASRLITLKLSNVPVEEVLRYATEAAGVTYRIEDYAVRIVSLSENTATIISKTYRVPPDFISNAPVGDQAPAAAPADPFATTPAGQAGKLQIRRMGAKEFLESRGVTFPEGTGATYNPVTNVLMVRTTAQNLETVDLLVEQATQSGAKQVVIETRVLEVANNALRELGFDWLLGALGSRVQLNGGTPGNQQPPDFAANPFNFPQNALLGPLGPLTAGNRSAGNATINAGIDSVLAGALAAATTRGPAVFSLAGVLTGPQFQVVIRAIDQKTGIDTLASPSIVTKSGQKASIDIARELIYPTEFDPPQVPTAVGVLPQVRIIGVNYFLAPPIVTPTTPTAFETRKTGVTLEVEPVISDDGRTVDMVITPQITDFDGFVNYGSPINGMANGQYIELTPNLIFQPIFTTRKVVTGVKIYDGATVVIGGLLSDNTVEIEDKVPVIGDIPLVGRLFKSKVTQKRTKSLIFFLTVKVIDPGGNRIHPTTASAQ